MLAKFHRDLTAEEKNEISDLAITGGDAALIPADLAPSEKPARISLFLETPETIDPEQARTLSFTLGSLYGVLLEHVYGWSWAIVRFDDGEERFGVLSPDKRFGVLVHEMFFNHLTGAKECRFALLFDLLAKGLPKAPPSPGITLLS
jgi:hypothetical protein